MNRIYVLVFLLIALLCITGCTNPSLVKPSEGDTVQNKPTIIPQATPVTTGYKIEINYESTFSKEADIIYKADGVNTTDIIAGSSENVNGKTYSYKVYGAQSAENPDKHLLYELTMADESNSEVVFSRTSSLPSGDDATGGRPYAVIVSEDDDILYSLVVTDDDTYVLDAKLAVISEYDGTPVRVGKNTFVLNKIMNIAGDKYVSFVYTLDADTCKAADAPYAVTHMDNGDFTDKLDDSSIFVPYHIVMQDFSAVSDGSEIRIKTGAKLKITETDLENKIWFVTDSGINGYFEMDFSALDKLIDGKPIEEVLSNVGCAG